MAEYHFVSIWQIQAPIERVWEEIYHAERWPSWWNHVVGVDELEPGAADRVGKHLRLLFGPGCRTQWLTGAARLGMPFYVLCNSS